MKKHNLYKIATIIIFLNFLFFSTPQIAMAFFDDLEDVGVNAGYDPKKTDPSEAVGSMLGIVLSFLGVVFLILMIYGGFMWMTSAGNDEQVKKARGVIVAAIIGLIIVVSAYAITSFIGEKIAP